MLGTACLSFPPFVTLGGGCSVQGAALWSRARCAGLAPHKKQRADGKFEHFALVILLRRRFERGRNIGQGLHGLSFQSMLQP